MARLFPEMSYRAYPGGYPASSGESVACREWGNPDRMLAG
jgi:hypothetical protein